MKSIVFSGNSLNGFFASEVAKLRGYEYIHIQESSNIKLSISDILFEIEGKNAKCIIIDVLQFADEHKVICENISNLKKATSDIKIICYMPGFDEKSMLCKSLLDYDIKDFIFSAANGDLKMQLEDHLTGMYKFTYEGNIEDKIKVEKEKKSSEKPKKHIAVGGIGRFTGCSSLCFQLVKYLNFKGYKACYIEFNDIKYSQLSLCKNISKWFSVEKKEDYFSFKGIDIYEKDNVLKAINKAYDFYIYDYADIYSEDFERSSFLKEEFKILTTLSKAQNLDQLIKTSEEKLYDDCKLVINFADEAHKEDLLNMLKKDTNEVYFADFMPDMFSFKAKSFLDELLDIEAKKKEKEKKGVFKRIRKRK